MAQDKFSLADFQQWMMQRLINPALGHAGGAAGPTTEAIIKSSDRLPAWQHLAIYQRAYTARLQDCLSKQFSALEHALGPELFAGFVDEYLRKYPSENYSLAQLGDRFVQYLEESRPDRNAPVREQWPDFMIELARFEWSINKLFDAEISSFSPANNDTSTDQLRIAPGIMLLQTTFPVRWYYQAVAREEDPELPSPTSCYYALQRRNYRLFFHDLHPLQYQLLNTLQRLDSLQQALDVLQVETEDQSINWSDAVVDWSPNWVANWVLCETEGQQVGA